MSQRIGFTTTIPVEAILAADKTPVDLNNYFVGSTERDALLAEAEDRGLPASTCAWIKGIYAAVRRGAVDLLIVVLEGDCSNTHALAELLSHDGVDTLPFRFPYDRDPDRLQREISGLCEALGTSLSAAEAVRESLRDLRHDLAALDRCAWDQGALTQREVRDLLLASSDFRSDVDEFRKELGARLARAESAPAADHRPRIALAGVPAAFDDLADSIESAGGRLVLDEIPRQFSMPFLDASSLVDQYLSYTYPYDVFHRLADLRREIERRQVQALVHYVQAFCHRQIEDVVLREHLGIPVLTLEGDRPGPLDERSRVRLQAFVEMIGVP